MKINVSCVQMKPVLMDIQANVRKMEKFIKEIAEENKNVNLIIFPELITSGYECDEGFYNLAERIYDGFSIEKISKLAKKYKVSIIYGFPERDEQRDNVIYNSSVYIDNKGVVLGTYRKVHLFDSEKKYFTPGSEFPIFNTDFGKVAMMICWDTAFPEVARIYALNGAELIAISTNWEKPYSEDWDLVTSARAFDNCIYIAAANRIGQDKKLSFFGHSRIVSPLGKPIKELNEEVEGVISSQLDLETAKKLKRDYYTLFEDRRPELYKRILE
ncbi:carbon-nitrogen hydrolase family protein [Clostridium felsineum]|uniref:(R)-stereoselective amidase n=1 Tax=Clostridium felsineum TaxID=36839 RepID=A0A1S8MA99_9CLOT|nr:carbon-nitrogen hydrolase family protein [Clostridium felsineum]MCR3760480.1 carbon-nitrogen hydrolase family protein [Clostridium felsineum]URZ08799.1 (R)-stereoselective amidase [Clostridium felsineum]URZ09427.1 (R)-stereoselective amidase [Clostridium felsineum]URZ14217.1 (R)-stereoselective amidase [Clostridium felsineum DSM 794]